MGFSTSLRTIQRDLQSLSTIFSIIEIKGAGRGNEGCGWAFEKNATLGIPLMDPSAALTFKLANQYLQQVMPKDALQHIQPYLDEADSVLRGFNKRGYRSWPDKVSVYTRSDFLKPAELDADTTAIIYEALLDNKRFVACYKDKPNQVISPLGMVARGSTIYLICTFNDYEDKRITALHRFSDVKLTTDSVKKHKDFDLKEYIKSGNLEWVSSSHEGSILLEILILKGVARHLKETPLSDDQQVDVFDDKRERLQATVLDTNELRWWLLSFGHKVEVIKPLSLRKWIGDIAREMSEQYLR